METVRKLCTTLDVKNRLFLLSLRISQAIRPAIRHFRMIIFVPGSFFFRQYKDRFHKRVGYGCVLTYRSEVRHERCEVYADVFTTTDIVLYIIHLLTYLQ